MDNTALELKEKEKVLYSVIDALQPVDSFDVNSSEVKYSVKQAIEIFETYPGIETFKKRVLKYYTPEHYVLRAQSILKGIHISGEANEESFVEIIKSLGKALLLIKGEQRLSVIAE